MAEVINGIRDGERAAESAEVDGNAENPSGGVNGREANDGIVGGGSFRGADDDAEVVDPAASAIVAVAKRAEVFHSAVLPEEGAAFVGSEAEEGIGVGGGIVGFAGDLAKEIYASGAGSGTTGKMAEAANFAIGPEESTGEFIVGGGGCAGDLILRADAEGLATGAAESAKIDNFVVHVNLRRSVNVSVDSQGRAEGNEGEEEREQFRS